MKAPIIHPKNAPLFMNNKVNNEGVKIIKTPGFSRCIIEYSNLAGGTWEGGVIIHPLPSLRAREVNFATQTEPESDTDGR